MSLRCVATVIALPQTALRNILAFSQSTRGKHDDSDNQRRDARQRHGGGFHDVLNILNTGVGFAANFFSLLCHVQFFFFLRDLLAPVFDRLPVTEFLDDLLDLGHVFSRSTATLQFVDFVLVLLRLCHPSFIGLSIDFVSFVLELLDLRSLVGGCFLLDLLDHCQRTDERFVAANVDEFHFVGQPVEDVQQERNIFHLKPDVIGLVWVGANLQEVGDHQIAVGHIDHFDLRFACGIIRRVVFITRFSGFVGVCGAWRFDGHRQDRFRAWGALLHHQVARVTKRLTHIIKTDGAGQRACFEQRRVLQRRVLLGIQGSGIHQQNFVQVTRDGALLAERIFSAGGLVVNKDKQIVHLHRQVGIGVVVLPSQVGIKTAHGTGGSGHVEFQQIPKFTNVSFGHWPTATAHSPTGALLRLPGRRDVATCGRKRILENGCRDSRLNCIEQPRELLRSQRRRLHSDQCSELIRSNGSTKVDFLDVILFGQFVDQRMLRNLLHSHPAHHHPAHQPSIRGDNPEAFAFTAGDGLDRAYEFVLNRDPIFQHWNGDLIQTATKGHAENQLLGLHGPFFSDNALHRNDSEPVLGQLSLVAEELNIVMQIDIDFSPRSRGGTAELFQQIDQLVTGPSVLFGHFIANKSIDHDRSFGIQIADQLLGRRRQGTDGSFGRVETAVPVAKQRHRTARENHQSQHASEIMPSHRVAILASGPVSATDQHHADVQSDSGDQQEIGHRGKADDTASKVIEGSGDPRSLQEAGNPARWQQRSRQRSEGERSIEQGPEDKTNSQVTGQERRNHTDRQHHEPNKPVSEVSGKNQARVDLPLRQHRQRDERRDLGKQQRSGENRGCRHVLANHDVKVVRRQGKQQFVSALPLLFRPNTHRDRWNKDQQDQRKPAIQLVQGG